MEPTLFNDPSANDAVLLFDKPSGMTSFGVVARVRRKLSKAAGKKVKVGHCGTLDPFATGLMIIVTGKECRNAGLYSKQDKTYNATIVLGQTSTTGDPEGEISDVSTAVPSRDDIVAVLPRFTGIISQTPPIYSAIKVDGVRAYKHARAGNDVLMKPREITVHSLDVIDYAYPLLKIRTNVSSGTYIRTLAQDIGAALGTGAYTKELRRLDIGELSLADARNLDEFMDA